jgi:hypothetical protein
MSADGGASAGGGVGRRGCGSGGGRSGGGGHFPQLARARVEEWLVGEDANG